MIGDYAFFTIINQVHKILRNFPWTGEENRYMLMLAKWDGICGPKIVDGWKRRIRSLCARHENEELFWKRFKTKIWETRGFPPWSHVNKSPQRHLSQLVATWADPQGSVLP